MLDFSTTTGQPPAIPAEVLLRGLISQEAHRWGRSDACIDTEVCMKTVFTTGWWFGTCNFPYLGDNHQN